MRSTAIFSVLMICALTGCASNSGSSDVSSAPQGIQAAFVAKHPYATMGKPIENKNPDGAVTFTVPYTQPDGISRAATYDPAGVLLDDK